MYASLNLGASMIFIKWLNKVDIKFYVISEIIQKIMLDLQQEKCYTYSNIISKERWPSGRRRSPAKGV